MKNLSLVVMFMLLFVACSDDDDSWSAKDLEGKWSIYEFVEDGETEEVSLKTELSYFELKSNKDYEAFDYYDYSTVKGSYSLSGMLFNLFSSAFPFGLFRNGSDNKANTLFISPRPYLVIANVPG